MNRTMSAILGGVVMTGFLAWLSTPLLWASPSTSVSDQETQQPVHLEQPDNPLAVPDIEQPAQPGTITILPAINTRFAPVQVNVNASGQNILFDAANEPSIAVDPTNPQRIVIGWRQFDIITSNFRQAGVAYSHDGGETWTANGPLDAGNFRSDPVLSADNNGTIYYNSLRAGFVCDFFLSHDGGMTWTDPIPAFGGDKLWFVVDTISPLGMDNIYCAWNVNAGCCGQNTFTRSVDGAQSFMNPIIIPSFPIFGLLAVDENSALYIVGVSPGGFDSFLLVKSTDAWNPAQTPTFDFVTDIDMNGAMALGSGPNPVGLLGQASVAVDTSGGPDHGNVYVLCSVDPPGNDPLDVHFVRSTDGGVTFSEPIRINDDPQTSLAWQWFGTMSVAPNGRIDVVWNDTRISADAQWSELYYAYSMDGGLTFSENVPLTIPFAHHLGYPNQNKLGDYYDMISDNFGASLAFAATFNGEQDVYYLRIGDFDCNENGIPDHEDIAAGTSSDCNDNGRPDECEIDEGIATDCNENDVLDECDLAAGTSFDCNLNQLPDECDIVSGFSDDCNINGIPDSCEVVDEMHANSGELSPIGGSGFEQSFTITEPAHSQQDVLLTVTAFADLNKPSEYIDVELNGQFIGRIFEERGHDCPTVPDETLLIIAQEDYNAAVDTGQVTINLIPSIGVYAFECNDPSYAIVDVAYFLASDLDHNGNGVPDECERSKGVRKGRTNCPPHRASRRDQSPFYP